MARSNPPPAVINRSTCQRCNTSRRHARPVRIPQFWTAATIQFWRLALNPSPDRDVIDAHVALRHDPFQISEAYEKRRYQRTQRTMISASKCRPLNSAGRFRFVHVEAYQTDRT